MQFSISLFGLSLALALNSSYADLNCTEGVCSAALLQRAKTSTRSVVAFGEDVRETRENSSTTGCSNCVCQVTSAADCGTDTITDGSRCGFDHVRDGSTCGWDIAKSCHTRRRRRWKAKFKVTCNVIRSARSCSVPKRCSVPRSCNVKVSFTDCFNAIANSLDSSKRQLADMVFDTGCTSASGCKTAVLDGLSEATDHMMSLLLDQAKDKAKALVGSSTGLVSQIRHEASGLAHTVKTKAVEMSSTVGQLIANHLPSYQKYDLGSVCTPHNSGFWYMTPTDCGLFDELSSLTVSNAATIFGRAKDKLRECVELKGLLNVPSPFWQLQFQSWCLPGPIVTAMEYFLGALVWQDFQPQEPSGTAIKEVLRSSVQTISNALDHAKASIGLAQLAAGQGANSTTSCGDNTNWGLEVAVAFEISVTVAGTSESYNIGIGLLVGCRSNSPVPPNLLLRIGKAMGATTSAGGASAAILTQLHFYESYPQFTARYAFGASLDLTLEADLTEVIGAPVGAGVPVVLGIYPSPSVPSSFSFQVATELGDDLIQAGEEMKEAASKASALADEAGGNGFIAGLAAAAEHLGRHAPQLQEHLTKETTGAALEKLAQHVAEPGNRAGLVEKATQVQGEGPIDFSAEAALGWTFCITPLTCFGQS